jgi:hypothetical protein
MNDVFEIELPESADPDLDPSAAAARSEVLGPYRYTVPTIAKALNKTPRTIESWLAKGMPRLKVGSTVYISAADARDWLIGQRTAA